MSAAKIMGRDDIPLMLARSDALCLVVLRPNLVVYDV